MPALHRVVFRPWVLLVLAALPASAESGTPLPAALKQQLEQQGQIPWSLEVDLNEDYQERNPSEKRTDTYSAHLSAVVMGPPPAAHLALNLAQDMWVKRAVTGNGSSSIKSDDSHVDLGGNADEGTLGFMWDDTTGQRLLTADVGFRLRGTSSGMCWDETGSKQHTCSESIDNGSGSINFSADETVQSVTFAKRGTTYTVEGTTTTPLGDGSIKVTVHAKFSPQAEPKYEAVLRPADPKLYERWMPEGPKLSGGSDDEGGNTLGVVLELRDKKTRKPIKTGFTATWRLAPSRLPGWCMNAPKPQDANTKPDLFFAQEQNSGKALSDEGQTLVTSHAMGQDSVIVTARDYGAYGTVSVDVTLDEGGTLTARTVDAKGELTQEPFSVPEDQNGNHIADSWEKHKDVHVFDRKLKPETDDEDAPSGMATQGDGYTLFEEYRGFELKGDAADSPCHELKTAVRGTLNTYARLDPHRKELFVVSSGGMRDDLEAGALAWGRATDVCVFIVPDNAHLAELPGDDKDFPVEHVDEKTKKKTSYNVDLTKHPRWADFNAEANHPELFGKGQVAVRLMTDGQLEALAFSAPAHGAESYDAAFRPNHTAPKDGVGVQIHLASVTQQIKDYAWWADHPEAKPEWDAGMKQLAASHPELDRHKIAAYALRNLATLRALFVRFIVMHELGHNTGGQEHRVVASLKDKIDDPIWRHEQYFAKGEASCPQRYWQFTIDGFAHLEFLAGLWDFSKDPNGNPWHYCSETWPTMRLRQREGQQWEPRPSPRD